MRFTTVSSALLVAGITASAVPAHKQVSALDDSFAVPGDNPLLFCEDPSANEYILDLESVDLSPNPPAAGQNLTITAKGTFTKDIEEGAEVHLQVKYGPITIIRQTADLCETVKNVDLECPLKKGYRELTKEVSLPSVIPPGKYTVLADVYTKDEKKITCLTATVEFHREELLQQPLGIHKGHEGL